MPVIEPRKEGVNPAVGNNSAPGGSSSGASQWKRFTAACARIAESLLSKSDQVCGQFPCEPSSTNSGAPGQSDHVKMSVDDTVVRKAKPKRVSLRQAGSTFKSGMRLYHDNLQKNLPTIVEKNEYAKSSPSGGFNAQASADNKVAVEKRLPKNGFNATNALFHATAPVAGGSTLNERQILSKEFAAKAGFKWGPNPFYASESKVNSPEVDDGQSLSKEFAAKADFKWEPNPFDATSSAAGNSIFDDFEHLPKELARNIQFDSFPNTVDNDSLPVAKEPANRQNSTIPTRIVDRVPSDFPISRQQMSINLRGKILSENLKATRKLNVHNEVALNKFLGTLEQFVSDADVARLDAVTSSQAKVMFKQFCQQLGVSPFKKGFEG